MNNKKCIISFANSAGRYMENLARLENSLKGNFDGDFLGFVGEDSIGAPLHVNNPYSFKIFAFEKALQAGYTSILWLDSSVFAIGKLGGLFDTLGEQGFIFQEAGHYLGNWANDKCLDYFGISREDAMDIPMIGNAGFLGLDFSNGLVVEFFDTWRESMNAGCFKGAWTNDDKTESEDERCKGSRHDMQCSSAIVHKMELFHLAFKGDKVLQYAGVNDDVLNDTIVLKAEG